MFDIGEFNVSATDTSPVPVPQHIPLVPRPLRPVRCFSESLSSKQFQFWGGPAASLAGTAPQDRREPGREAARPRSRTHVHNACQLSNVQINTGQEARQGVDTLSRTTPGQAAGSSLLVTLPARVGHSEARRPRRAPSCTAPCVGARVELPSGHLLHGHPRACLPRPLSPSSRRFEYSLFFKVRVAV